MMVTVCMHKCTVCVELPDRFDELPAEKRERYAVSLARKLLEARSDELAKEKVVERG